MTTTAQDRAESMSPTNMWNDWTNGYVNEIAANFRRLAGIPGFVQRTQNIKKGASESEVAQRQLNLISGSARQEASDGKVVVSVWRALALDCGDVGREWLQRLPRDS